MLPLRRARLSLRPAALAAALSSSSSSSSSSRPTYGRLPKRRDTADHPPPKRRYAADRLSINEAELRRQLLEDDAADHSSSSRSSRRDSSSRGGTHSRGGIHSRRDSSSRNDIRRNDIRRSDVRSRSDISRKPALLDVEALRETLRVRPRRSAHDFMTPTHAHLLDLTLFDALPQLARADHIPEEKDLLPASDPPPERRPDRRRQPPPPRAARPAADRFLLPSMSTGRSATVLPHGYHLVYFPLQLPPSLLLPDGTDPAQAPGPPFVRRMWAGGHVRFKYPRRLRLDGQRAVCVERLDADSLRVRGTAGREHLYVDVWRRYGPLAADLDVARFGHDAVRNLETTVEADPAVEERRTLVFLRDRDDHERAAAARPNKIVRAPRDAEYSFTMIPTQAMLFQFSALTFNTHAIHLDPQYCREVEGHRGLLVHGPLTLVLMLAALRARVTELLQARRPPQPFTPRSIISIEYRNLAPLYAGEPLRVCLRRNTVNPVAGRHGEYLKWDVWVENHEGGLAVRGSAITRGKPPKGQVEEGKEEEEDNDDDDDDANIDDMDAVFAKQ